MDKWEYCALMIANITQEQASDVVAEGIKCWVRFTGPDQQRIQYDVTPHTDNANAVWLATLGRLGEVGWELVSVQHGNFASSSIAAGFTGVVMGQWVDFNNGVAYFKRRVTSGLAVNEPGFTLPQEENSAGEQG